MRYIKRVLLVLGSRKYCLTNEYTSCRRSALIIFQKSLKISTFPKYLTAIHLQMHA